MSRYTKQRAKPPRTPRSIHSGSQTAASPAASVARIASYKPGPKTTAQLATQLSATSRRVTPGRMPLPEVSHLTAADSDSMPHPSSPLAPQLLPPTLCLINCPVHSTRAPTFLLRNLYSIFPHAFAILTLTSPMMHDCYKSQFAAM